MNKKIKIKKSPVADTRTCDWSKVTKKQLLKASKQHIKDVKQGIKFLIEILKTKSQEHDWTKIMYINSFYEDFKTGFKKTDWWEMHQKTERHHFNKKKYIRKDINLLDILEQIVDGVIAGLTRSGKYRYEPIDDKTLQKAYRNTAKLLINNIEIED